MNIKTHREILREAINSGCRTVAELAHFLRVRAMLEQGYRTF